jgi:hypothetical protein
MGQLSREELHRLARLGASARLEELKKEELAIRAAFPDLGRKSGKTGAASSERRQVRMSAAARKAVSERMTKYWAARRKAKAAGRS